MLDASNVRVGVTGAVYVAPSGSTLPTGTSSAINSSFEDVGYIHEDGVTETQDTDTEDIVAWQNGATVRKIQTSHDLMYAFTMLETNDVTLKEYYGDFTAGALASDDDTVEIRGEELPRRAWVLSVLDGDHVIRAVIPDGQVTERGEVVYANGEAVAREVTITCYPDTDGVKAYVYLNDGSV